MVKQRFVLPTRHPPSPHDLCNPGLVDVVHRERGDLESPPGQSAVAAGWRDASQMLFALVAYILPGVFGFARATSISPRTTVTPGNKPPG